MTAPVSPSSTTVLAGPALWLALLALAMGGFGIGTGEFAIMGILPDIAGFYAMSEPSAGHLISAYALGVVVGAPLIAVLGSGMPRRRLAIVMMLAYAAANFASAAAPGFGTLFVFRFVSGLPHGAYFGVAALIAASLVPPQRRGYAVGRVMMGLTVAALAGNPFAIWLGQAAGWRYPFA
ncbi:MAG: MFS transporter, partial [Candidimonas sp.]